MCNRINRVAIGIAAFSMVLLVSCHNLETEPSELNVMTSDGKFSAPDIEDRRLAALAIDLLAEELGVPGEKISIDTIRAVDWRDSSLGCSQPGQAYLQVITPGHKISLRYDGKLYFVHESNYRAVVCKGDKKTVGSLNKKMELAWGQQAAEARKDLARRIGVDEKQVLIASAQRTRWPDESLGCPEPGVAYEQRDVEGYILRMRYGNRDYTYHTDLVRVIPCPSITDD